MHYLFGIHDAIILGTFALSLAGTRDNLIYCYTNAIDVLRSAPEDSLVFQVLFLLLAWTDP